MSNWATVGILLLLLPLGCGGDEAPANDAGTTTTDDGACGAAQGTASTEAPDQGLCSTGSASAVTGDGPWSWTCAGDTSTANCSAPRTADSSFQRPGPSAALHQDHPYYTCVQNRYIATAADGGSDDNDGLEASVDGEHGPWLSLQHAADSIPDPAPGYCIHIADGTYVLSDGVNIGRGGNESSTVGFAVWRSTNLLGAKLEVSGSIWSVLRAQAPYIIFDGIEIVGDQSDQGSGIDTCFSCCGYNGIHHIMLLNSYIHGMGGSGVAACWAEYYWFIHNQLDQNAYQSWFSGVSIYEPVEIPGYTPTAYDEQWTPYHNVIAYNRCFGNFTNPEGGPHTDGNGIIYDDTQHDQNAPDVVYEPRALIMGNVAWGNGGAGIQVGPGSAYADVVNNTAYDNYRDTVNDGTWRGEISSSLGIDNHFINNIGYAVPGSGILSNNAPFLGGDPRGENSWSSNIAFGNSPHMLGTDAFPSSSNLADTDPMLIDIGAGNFALSTTSPAVGAGELTPYWQEQEPASVDIGACPAELSSCP